ncbi:MAG TPA: protein kinase [Kofleriaceae bacterium]
MRIGRYEVLSHLATGGMAEIYLARQSGLGSFERHVVLKTILRERASDQRFVTMFLDEAKLAATLNHQNIAQVFEVDQADGAYFMAMEFVHGENTRTLLETTIRRNWAIPLELAVMIISGAAAGLHHAHERRGKNGQPLNIVHRDVSPANIMVGYDGAIKVLDFGIAKADERATQTMGGTIKGKYGYMSPEQCKGNPIDRRSDIFALGIVLYELATLRRAFKGKDDFETMKRIVAGDLVLPTTIVPGFPRELEAIILTALANDASARFQTAQEMIEALDAFAVRAQLTGSNTAMSRFMTQLFGVRKEPWIEQATQAALASADMTVVTTAEPMELGPDGGPGGEPADEPDDGDENENDETLILSNKQDVQHALDQLVPSPRRAAEPRPSLPFAVPGQDRTPPPQHYTPPPMLHHTPRPMLQPQPMPQPHHTPPPMLQPPPQHTPPPQYTPPPVLQHPHSHSHTPPPMLVPVAPPGAQTAPSFPAAIPHASHAHGSTIIGTMAPMQPPPVPQPPPPPLQYPRAQADDPSIQLRSNKPWIALGVVAVLLVVIVIAIVVAV